MLNILFQIIIRFLRGIGILWVCIWGLLMVATVAVHLGILADDSLAIITVYFSPLWYGVLLLIGILLLMITGYFKFPLIMLCFWFFYFIAFGDHSIWIDTAQPNFNPTQEVTKFKVAAINARFYSYGIDTVVEGIKQLDADIILLSEHRLDVNQNKSLENQLSPMRLYHGKLESTAILSRFPVLKYQQVDFPTHQASLSGSNDLSTMHLNPFRSFSHAVVDVAGKPIDIISVRLIAGQAKERSLTETWRFARYLLQEQKKELKFFLNYLDQLEHPVIFGGDLNTPPSALVGDEFNEIARDTYLSHNFWGNLTFKGVGPMAFIRLDYLFSTGDIKSLDAWIERLPISDHWPIVAVYAIPSK